MTSATQIPGTAPREAFDGSLAVDFANLAAHLADRPDAILPDEFTMRLPAPWHLDQDQRITWIHEVARTWGVLPVREGDGTLTAALLFGRVRLTATVDPGSPGHVVRHLHDARRRNTASTGLEAIA